jgi:hypothetical protein
MAFPKDVFLGNGEQHAIPTVEKLFPIGTRGYCGDRVFRYVKFGDVDGSQGTWDVETGMPVESGKLVYSTQVDVAGDDFTAGGQAGDKTITVQDATTGYWAADAFENGTFNYNYNTVWSCRIVGNTATGTVGENSNCSVVTLETALPINFSASESYVRFLKSKYMDVVVASGGASEINQAAVGVAIVFNYTGRTVTTEGRYGWIQTWGPTCIQIATSHEGGTSGERQLSAYGAGGAQCIDNSDKYQTIGHYLQGVHADITKPLIYLTIAP